VLLAPPRLLLVGIAIAVVFNGVLAGFYSNQGTMQNGLVPLGLGASAVLAAHFAALGAEGLAATRRVAWFTVLIGTLAWFVTNAGTSAGLWLSASFRRRFLTGSEGDYLRVLQDRLHPLGTSAFPAVPCLCAALLLLTLLIWRRSARGPNSIDRAPNRSAL
jgi:hypothetical protein